MPPENDSRSADVSVIIPAYRAAATIRRALESVAAQTVKPSEVIVVDDGSDDATSDAAKACTDLMEGIELKVFSQPNRGAGAARNRALAEARGTYVAFLDADDEWLAAKLERSMAHLLGTDNVLVAHDGWIVGDGQETLNACARRFREGADPFVQLYRKGYIDTCSVVARRAAIDAAGGFDEDLPNAQDFDLWLKMVREPGTPFEVFDEPLVRYHAGDGGIMGHTERRLACCLIIARRYAPDLCRRPGSVLVSLAYRVLALHAEAMAAYRKRGRFGALARTALALPFTLVRTGAWWKGAR
ncbi:MAG: glycosyltransferase [Rhodospirillales bacterium]|jgi:glycosyltransferase involved in cell wall biosynthesis|nr:glycosyltransferase [Rhodospirillales bacterium]